MMQSLPSLTSVGGLGCKHCMFWERLNDPELQDSLGMSGTWGRCKSTGFQHSVRKMQAQEAELTDREKQKIRIRSLYGDFIPYTEHSYSCGNIRILKQ